jgi:AcrR family transcriptional regulator
MHVMTKPLSELEVADLAFSFREWLVERQDQVKGRRKGERTRDRIRLATVDLLNERGFRELRVSDVCERAAITPPVLYLYFNSKQALVEDVLREFLDRFSLQRARQPAQTAYESIREANLRWILWAKANSGLIQCLFEFSNEIPEFGSLYAKANHEWHLRTAQAIMRRFPPNHMDLPSLHLTIIAFGGMMDDITRKLYSMPDSNMLGLVNEVAGSDEHLADFLSHIWFKTLYPASPRVP